jgi:hypothetical protein
MAPQIAPAIQIACMTHLLHGYQRAFNGGRIRGHEETLAAHVEPLPKGYSGTIKVVRPKSHIEGNLAILSYDMDETETIFGQAMTAR